MLFHVDTPDVVCEILDVLLTEMDNSTVPNLCWRGREETIGATFIEMAAQQLYSRIAMGECITFLNIDAKCDEHSQPCRKCASARVLSNQKPSMGSIAKSISENISLDTIVSEKLFEIKYEVLMRHEKVLNKMYPVSQAQTRLSSSCSQVHRPTQIPG